MRIVLSQNRYTGDFDPVVVDGQVVKAEITQEVTAFGTARLVVTIPDKETQQ